MQNLEFRHLYNLFIEQGVEATFHSSLPTLKIEIKQPQLVNLMFATTIEMDRFPLQGGLSKFTRYTELATGP